MGFVDDHGIFSLGKNGGVVIGIPPVCLRLFFGLFLQPFGDPRKLLKSSDNDGNAPLKGFCEVGGVFVDFLNDALLMFELLNRVL